MLTKRTRSKRNASKKEQPISAAIIELVNTFNKDEVISEWQYELDAESKLFCKPVIPALSDAAILPFLSVKAKPPKTLIYDCPFCHRMFTYPLVFKNHLYSCSDNTNVPE